MAYYDHLPLRQINHIGDRRKSGGGELPPRIPEKHAVKLKSEVDAVVEAVSHVAPTDGIDPTLIVKIHVSRQLTDDDWKAVDLQTLSQVTNEAVILFSADSELNEFRRRLEEYSDPKPQGNKGHKYAQLFEVIDGISPLSPEDRIGPALTAEGISSTDHFDPEVSYLLDLELWCPSGDLVDVFINRVIAPLENGGGELLDRYTPPSGILLRVRGNGQAIRELLTRDEVAIVDLPPQPDLEYSDAPDPDVDQVGSILSPDPMAITIGIVDSGVNDEHPLLRDVVVGSFGVGGQPGSDSHGHGTSVAAIAAYGDLDAMLRNREFKPKFQIASARVLDDRGRFPDIEIAHRLVEEAICRLHEEYGCRVINMSLGNRLRLVDERGTLWSESLDRLARELDLIIVVSAGNVGRTQLQKTYGDDIPYAYPDYLRDACNRIVDPAGAANVLTVGSVAHVNGLAEGNPISIQSLASKDEPSPFTRTGPGIRGALKPDLVDRGGNAVFDGLTSSLKDGARHPPAGVLTLNHRYTEHLFKTASGTSFAAPLVAYKAAMLMSGDIRQSANIIRALLALSAELPQAGVNKLNTTDYEARHSVLGCGIPDITRAIYSDDDRVVLVSESSLSHDQFAIFEIPITEEYQTTGGNREIRVSLAFYPDVRRTRKNYLGTQLQFDLVRGRASIAEIIEAYRALTKEERKQKIKLPSLLKRERCSFLPKINSRKLGTLQHGTFLMKRNIVEYGSTYYLVVRSSSQWAGNDQPFAVGVMLRHTAEISLYERIKARVRIRT